MSLRGSEGPCFSLSAARDGWVPDGASKWVYPVARQQPREQVHWQPGHWDGYGYRWQPGRYVVRVVGAARWIEGHWAARPRGYVWVAGHWA
ncbi:MAG: YXWGXW repeat-containing protein [Janthinobacterium lividum]